MTTMKNTVESNADLELFWGKENIKQRLKTAINQTYVCCIAASDSGLEDIEGGLSLLGELLTEIHRSIEPQPSRIAAESSAESV